MTPVLDKGQCIPIILILSRQSESALGGQGLIIKKKWNKNKRQKKERKKKKRKKGKYLYKELALRISLETDAIKNTLNATGNDACFGWVFGPFGTLNQNSFRVNALMEIPRN